jgi:6-phosphogluconolactonase (cycloisomerase 2 family)
MAIQKETCVPAAPARWQKIMLHSNITMSFLCLSFVLLLVSMASAQTSPQQYVYLSLPGAPSSSISGFSKTSQTGVLNSIPGSPFSDRLEGGLVAIDGQGKFLFVLNPKSNDISMFQIDQASGALSELSGSPFAVPPTVNPNMAPSQPISITAESSGKFRFVGYLSGDFPGASAVVSLSINTSGSSPALLTAQSVELNNGGAPIQLLTDPKGLRLYVGLGTNSMTVAGADVYSIDSSTGMLAFQGTADAVPDSGLSYALDPRSRFFFAGGRGGSTGFLESCVVSPVDGTASACLPILFLNTGDVPTAMVGENSGQFLYVTLGQTTGNVVVVYSVDQTTGALTQVLGPLTGIPFANGSTVADPMGPYLYAAQFATPTVIHAYQVNQQTGTLSEIFGSPFSSGGTASCCGGLAISGNSAQAISGPAVSIFPSTANFSAVVGTTSPTQVFSVVNTGNQLLSINSISITGTNASSFSQTNTCLSTLAPNANCSVSITFAPASVGALTANLQVADNAPGTPQTLVLNGTGIAPAPAVTFSPATPSFPVTTQGASTAPQTLTVISSGNAALHISSVSLSGPNPSDFSFTNNCTAPLAPGANCTISLVFSPTAAGQRIADLLIADDAPGSPQSITLSGTGIALAPALTLSPPVPSFPATTQGTSSPAQTLTVANSGNAPLTISSVSLGGANPSDFSSTSNCTAPVAVGSNCTISLVFNPLASGQRTASVLISDNVPGSPQAISLSATANPAFSVAAASGSSTMATVSAGQSAQYQLQLTPGSGFSDTVSLSCSGAPLGAVCQAPASVSLANGAATTFTVTVTTSGPALLPPATPLRLPPTSHMPPLALLSLAMLLLFFALAGKIYRAFDRATDRNHLALYGVLSAAVLCAAFAFAGCGGGSSVALQPPPPIITPSGTSTITITLAANASSGQPLQLQPIQLTLTVK